MVGTERVLEPSSLAGWKSSRAGKLKTLGIFFVSLFGLLGGGGDGGWGVGEAGVRVEDGELAVAGMPSFISSSTAVQDKYVHSLLILCCFGNSGTLQSFA